MATPWPHTPEEIRLLASAMYYAYDQGRPLSDLVPDVFGSDFRLLTPADLGMPPEGQIKLLGTDISWKFDIHGYYNGAGPDLFFGKIKNAEAFAAYSSKSNSMIIGIRGTNPSSVSDWIDDIFSATTAHRAKLLPFFSRTVDFAADHAAQIYVAGHSLGGAMTEAFWQTAIDSGFDPAKIRALTVASPWFPSNAQLPEIASKNTLAVYHTNDGVFGISAKIPYTTLIGYPFEIENIHTSAREKIDAHKVDVYFEEILNALANPEANFLLQYASVKGNIISYYDPDDPYAYQSISSPGDGRAVLGGEGPNDIYGTLGSDVLIGGGRGDRIQAGAFNDYLFGGEGIDVLDGGAHDDLLLGGPGADSLRGGPGADRLIGDVGGPGYDDILTGGPGNDPLLNGGPGNDIYVFSPGSDSDIVDERGGGGTDTLKFRDIAPEAVQYAVDGDDFVLTFGADSVRITAFASPEARIELAEFTVDGLPVRVDLVKKWHALGGGVDLPDGPDPDPDVNHPPVVEGSGRVELQVGQTVSGFALFGQIWDPDGYDDLAKIVFWDSTPGAGWIELDGRKTTRAEVAPGETWRVKYVAGDEPGSNDIVVEAFDRSGADSNDLTVRVVVGGLERGPDISGSDADDTLNGSDLAENIFGGNGNDIIYAGGGSDGIFGDPGSDFIYGDTGADIIFDGNGNDTVYAGAGDDILMSGSGSDTLAGNDGHDIYVFADDFGNDNIGGEDYDPGIDEIRFGANISPGTVRFRPIGDYDSVTGLRITAGASGSIAIWGQYAVPDWAQSSSPVVIERAVFADGSEVDLTGGLLVEGTEAAESGDGALHGTAFADTIRAYGGNDTVYAHAGDDLVEGGAGDDTLQGGDGDDVLRGGDGNDSLLGGAGADDLDGGPGNDSLSGDDGDDTYRFAGAWGSDTVTDGGAGSEVLVFADLTPDRMRFLPRDDGDYDLEPDHLLLVGPDGSRVTLNWHYEGARVERAVFADGSEVDLTGGLLVEGTEAAESGDGALHGTAFADTIRAYGGNDTVYAHAGDDLVEGGAGDDTLQGGDGDDVLRGGDGNDSLLGGAGADDLDGGPGNDSLSGDDGDDTYRFAGAWGSDTVTDGGAGSEVLVFADLTPDRMRFLPRDDGDYDLEPDHLLLVGPDGSRVTLNWHYEGARVERAVFADGSEVDLTGGLLVEGTEAAESGDGALHGTAFADTIRAYGGNDTVYAHAGDDLVEGGAGDDTLQGGDGDDVLRGGDGNDSLLGGAGADDLDGGPGNDSLSGDDGDDTYRFAGAWGSDTVTDGGAGSEVLVFADLTPDRMRFLPRDDGDYDLEPDHLLLVGPDGSRVTLNWHYEGARVERAVFADGSEVDLTGGLLVEGTEAAESGDGALHGTAFADTIRAYGGNDTVYAHAGDDLVEGGAGDDTLQGGDGDDVLRGGDGNDSLLGGAGADDLDGGPGNDSLSGDDGDDTYRFAGAWGSDTVTDGGAGSEVLVFADLTPDRMRFLPRDDGDYDLEPDHLLLVGPDGSRVTLNWHYEGARVERAVFADGSEVDLTGGLLVEGTEAAESGDGALHGTAFADTIRAYGGNDTVYAHAGDDLVEGGAGDDTLQGGDGDDVLQGGEGNDWLGGAEGADRLLGDSGTDALDGGAGGDWLDGGTGDDVLNGGAGNDTLHGRGGRDSFVFDGDFGRDTIMDVENGETLFFPGLSLADLAPQRDGLDLLLVHGDDSVRVRNAYRADITLLINGESWSSGAEPPPVVPFGGGIDWTGTARADRKNGTNEDDRLDGRGGNDVLRGKGGDDVLIGGPGNDRVWGDAGTDTVVFSGDYADFRVRKKGTYWLVEDLDRSDGDEGTDRIYSSEILQFGDVRVDITGRTPTVLGPSPAAASASLALDDLLTPGDTVV